MRATPGPAAGGTQKGSRHARAPSWPGGGALRCGRPPLQTWRPQTRRGSASLKHGLEVRSTSGSRLPPPGPNPPSCAPPAYVKTQVVRSRAADAEPRLASSVEASDAVPTRVEGRGVGALWRSGWRGAGAAAPLTLMRSRKVRGGPRGGEGRPPPGLAPPGAGAPASCGAPSPGPPAAARGGSSARDRPARG